MTYT
jgi:hypothetical protein